MLKNLTVVASTFSTNAHRIEKTLPCKSIFAGTQIAVTCPGREMKKNAENQYL
jgi:hypothetical protein